MKRKLIISNLLMFLIMPFFKWWTILFFAFGLGYLSNTRKESLLLGFLSLSINWLLMIIIKNIQGGYIIMEKISIMLQINSSILLAVVSICLIGILGLTSSYLGFLIHREKERFINGKKN
tara:strand:+ start:59 stop:418 length:360 start_codon:yes stop_codon:yes gene_type:complete